MLTIVVNNLYFIQEKIYPPYVSKYNSNREKKLFFQWFRTEKDGIILQ